MHTSSLQLLLGTVAHYGDSCTRTQASRVLKLVGLSDKYDPLGPPLSVLHARLKLVAIDGETIAFVDKRVRELVHPVTLAIVKTLVDMAEGRALLGLDEHSEEEPPVAAE